MHELSIAQSICQSVAERVGDARVDEMIVEIGALSGVNRDSLQFCLGEAAPLCGVKLGRFDIRVVPARAAAIRVRSAAAKMLWSADWFWWKRNEQAN